jgi:hypothetical protein
MSQDEDDDLTDDDGRRLLAFDFRRVTTDRGTARLTIPSASRCLDGDRDLVARVWVIESDDHIEIRAKIDR